MSDTPDTDGECFIHEGDYVAEGHIPASFARKIERERDELRAEIERANKDNAILAGMLTECEHERDSLGAEVERLKAEAELYAGWSKWKDGIWRISHPDSGPSAEWIADDLNAAMKGAE